MILQPMGRPGICPPHVVAWSQEEDGLLIQCYGKLPIREVAQKFPSRTLRAVKHRMERIRERYRLSYMRRPFSSYEISLMRKHAGMLTLEQVAELLGRTRNAIHCRAKKERISFVKLGELHQRAKYSDETVRLVRALREDDYGRCLSFREIDEKLELTPGAAGNIYRYRHTREDMLLSELLP